MAAEVSIHLDRHAAAGAASGTLTARSASDSSRSLTFALPAASISLPAGDWFLATHIDGDWSEPRLITVRDEPQNIVLNGYPLARVTALVSVTSGREPKELQAYFHRVSLDDVLSPSEGNVTCGIEKKIATCELPAGEYDLAFRVSGFVSRYRWNAKLAPGAALDAGALEFVPGSTLSGRVEVPRDCEARLDRVNVVVRPATIAGANDAERHRNESARLTAHPTRRGFFAFDLPPGQFTVQASYETLISEETSVEVSAGHEALLRQPLRLGPRRSVTVRIHPPLDPWSKPWKIALARTDPTGFTLSERSLKTSPDGAVKFDDVLPGSHRLTVVRAAEQSWAEQTLDINRDAALDLNINVVRLTGRIRLGTRPLAATAMVRSEKSGAAAFFKSKADGTFAARLPAPENDTWDEIEIRADLPALKRTIQHVRYQLRDDGTAELNLDLPSRTISGTVVDEIGRPAGPAMIDIHLPDGSLQQVDTADGAFSVTGLESGRHRLRASTPERESIDLQEIVVSEDKDAIADVVLPVVPVGHLRGVVRAFDGPALGAPLYATRPGDPRPIILSRVDPEGHFDIRFPAATQEVVVAINAPGFAFRLAKTALSKDEQTFAVDQNGGTLSVDQPATRSGLRPYLMHNGAALPAIAAAYVAGATFSANLSDRVRFQIASAEPGPYSLCWLAEGTAAAANAPCVSGVLAPHGTLILADDVPQSAER
jgi:hypothetical protein